MEKERHVFSKKIRSFRVKKVSLPKGRVDFGLPRDKEADITVGKIRTARGRAEDIAGFGLKFDVGPRRVPGIGVRFKF